MMGKKNTIPRNYGSKSESYDNRSQKDGIGVKKGVKRSSQSQKGKVKTVACFLGYSMS